MQTIGKMKHIIKDNTSIINWQRGAILLMAYCLLLIFSSCKEKSKEKAVPVNKNVYYTCSMHPQVHEDHPGNCPICGMKLIAVSLASKPATATEIHLSAEQIRLGNIKTDTIGRGNIGSKLLLTGTLNFNQNELSSVNARVEGRVDKIYFKSVGDFVHKGDILFDLYSEQLNNAKQEYVNALEQESTIGNTLINYAALVESARNKLSLWGMSDPQIKQLAMSKKASTLTSFYSTAAGYITSFNVNEGDYVMEGGSIVQLANLATLWAEAQVYTTQMSPVNMNDKVTVQIPDLNNMNINGTVDFVNPEMNPGTRINLVRVTIQNKDNLLRPGMAVYLIINKKQHNSLTLPSDAILTDSKGSTVWVQTKSGVYEIRMVTTGVEESDAVEITSGLNDGDIVVTSGAYLLNSEFIFEHGKNPMAGMKM